jgi:hypothetical protein
MAYIIEHSLYKGEREIIEHSLYREEREREREREMSRLN